MSKIVFTAIAAAFAAGTLSTAASAAPAAAMPAGNAAAGEKLFNQCKVCHAVEKGVNRVGPSLWGVVGHKSGQAPGYKYSPANLKSGDVWTPATLFAYLEAPMKFMPGTKMAFAGVKKPQDRADIIAYLKTKA